MNTRMKASFTGYLLALLLFASFGFIYLFSPQFMPYHETAIGMPWEDVPRGFQIIITALMHSYGGSMLATALAIAAMVAIPFRKGETWVKYVLPAVSLVYSIPALLVTLTVRASTPAEPPWMAVVAGMVLVVVSFVLSLTDK